MTDYGRDASLATRVEELERENGKLVYGLACLLDYFKSFNDGECVAAVVPVAAYQNFKELAGGKTK